MFVPSVSNARRAAKSAQRFVNDVSAPGLKMNADDGLRVCVGS